MINVPGAGGTIGLAQFVNGPSRGSPLIVTGLGMVGAIDVNKSPVSLDQAAPLARMTGEYQPLVVGADSPIKTLDDLAAMYKADPGSVSWGGFALGSPDHLVSAMTVKAFGGDVKQMNYIVAGAGGEMLSQVLGGHITVATGGYNEFAGLIETGELRALAISSPERLPGVDIPTFKELGYDVELVNWRGLLAKPDLGDEDRAALDAAIGEMVKSDAWQALLEGARLGRHVPGLGDLRRLPRRGADPHRPDPRRARPRRVVTGWRPALRSAARCRHTGSRRASSKDRGMQAALDWLRRRDLPSSSSRWRCRHPRPRSRPRHPRPSAPQTPPRTCTCVARPTSPRSPPWSSPSSRRCRASRSPSKSGTPTNSTRPPQRPAGRAGPRPTC